MTVKIRKGFDDEHVNAVEIARIVEAAGAAAAISAEKKICPREVPVREIQAALRKGGAWI